MTDKVENISFDNLGHLAFTVEEISNMYFKVSRRVMALQMALQEKHDTGRFGSVRPHIESAEADSLYADLIASQRLARHILETNSVDIHNSQNHQCLLLVLEGIAYHNARANIEFEDVLKPEDPADKKIQDAINKSVTAIIEIANTYRPPKPDTVTYDAVSFLSLEAHP